MIKCVILSYYHEYYAFVSDLCYHEMVYMLHKNSPVGCECDSINVSYVSCMYVSNNASYAHAQTEKHTHTHTCTHTHTHTHTKYTYTPEHTHTHPTYTCTLNHKKHTSTHTLKRTPRKALFHDTCKPKSLGREK